MRIGLDAGGLLYRRMGMAAYAWHLLQALAELDEDADYVLLANSFRHTDSTRGLSRLGPHFSVRNPGLPSVLWRRLKDRWGVPVELFCGRVDIFHTLDPVVPRTGRARCVATVHDMIDFVLPDRFPDVYLSTPKWRAHYASRRQILQTTLSRAHKLIAVSENTKRDLGKYVGVAEDSVEVIPYGVGEEFRPIDESTRREVLARYGIDEEGFILWAGRIEHRKNLRAVLEALLLLGSRAREVKLVMCGWPGFTEQTEQGLDDIRRMGLSEQVVLVDYVAPEEMPAIYSAARLLVYPSLYEGFGLPPLEAMACGTPVVASDASSLPEVVGDAALTVDPLDYRGLADAIEAALWDETLREELRAHGIERAGRFTWRLAAEETMRLWQRLLGQG